VQAVHAAFAAESGSRKPPNGELGSNWLNVLHQTTPARKCCATHMFLLPSAVQAPAERPYGVLLALSIASSGVPERHDRKHGPEYLLTCDAVRWMDVRENEAGK